MVKFTLFICTSVKTCKYYSRYVIDGKYYSRTLFSSGEEDSEK